jgi:hypothetical protein
MATVSTLIDRIATVAGIREPREVITRTELGADAELREYPNEQIYFYVRKIDNSRIQPKADPKSTRACIKYLGGAALAVFVLVGVLFPIGYNVLAGYQIHALEKQQSMLLAQSAELELREAELLNPARLARLAEIQQLVDPAPETAVNLEPARESSEYEFALNH